MQRTHREQHSPTLAASAAPRHARPRLHNVGMQAESSTPSNHHWQAPWHPSSPNRLGTPTRPIRSGPNRGLHPLAARPPPTPAISKIHSLPCKRPQWPSPATVQHTLHSRVCHPLTACIALRLAYTHKIYLYFSTHRSLSARCDLSRVTYIPPRACAATCIASNAPRGPHVAALGPHAGLCDHACSTKKHKYACAFRAPLEHDVGPTTPPPRVYSPLATRIAPGPRATTELPVSLQRTPQPPMTLSRPAATSHAHHAWPREPTSRAEPWATTRAACATLSL